MFNYLRRFFATTMPAIAIKLKVAAIPPPTQAITGLNLLVSFSLLVTTTTLENLGLENITYLSYIGKRYPLEFYNESTLSNDIIKKCNKCYTLGDCMINLLTKN